MTQDAVLDALSQQTHDVIVIGAGIAGLGPAWKMALAGLKPLILERDTAGQHASTAAAGMLAPTAEVHFEELALLRLGQLSLQLYPELVAQLQAQTGIDVDYRSEGTLVIGLDRDDTEALDRLFDYQRSLGLEVHKLSGAQAQELEPALHPNTHRAVFCPTDHQVDPVRLIQALKAAALSLGATLVEHCPVASLWIEQQQCLGVILANGLRLKARKVLLAGGAWTRQLEGLPKRQLPHIRPVRGQMLSLKLQDPPLCRHVIRSPEAYLVPKSDGRMIIGATVEEMGFDARQTAGGVFELLRGAWEAMPGVTELELTGMWTGFRPTSLSNLPILGPHPDIGGLWLSTGHGRNGILLTAVTALRLGQSLCEDRVDKALLPFQYFQ